MKSTTTMTFVVAGLFVLSGVCFLPSVAGQGPESSLPQRVAVLEALVTDLTERVQDLEQGQAPPSTSFDVLHLNPLDDFPENPTEGDLCIKKDIWDPIPGYHPVSVIFLWCYIDGDWRWPTGYSLPME